MKGFNKTTPPRLPLCFTANTANSTVKLQKIGSPTSVTLETSSDGVTWSTYTMGSAITLSNIGDKVYFRNTSETDTGFSKNSSNYYQFVMSGSIAASGDVTSLLNKNCTTTLSNYCFNRLFRDCTSLVTAPELPATALADSCYISMFNGCTSLVTAPELPATTAISGCYQQMFNGCSSLTTAPELPATTLAFACYTSMFKNCTSLTRCPSLPATTMLGSCYGSMFYGCTALTTLPKLYALTIQSNCYDSMFYGCTNIKLSTSKTGIYQTAYVIPYSGTGTQPSVGTSDMFTNTGGTFTGRPSINTTYYTSNTLV